MMSNQFAISGAELARNRRRADGARDAGGWIGAGGRSPGAEQRDSARQDGVSHAWGWPRRAALALVLSCAALGCDSDKKETAAAAQTSASATSPAVSASAAATAPAPGVVRSSWPVAKGPRMAILPGEGVGPIRFGATAKTIQRHMQAPCEEQTETLCRYTGSAVDYLLKDGVLHEIRIHRPERQTSIGKPVGVFNGMFRGGAAFGMYPQAVIELLGEPARVEKVKDGGPSDTREVHYYDGMRLEYDKLPNGNVVLGGVILFESKTAAKKAAAKRAAQAAAARKQPH